MFRAIPAALAAVATLAPLSSWAWQADNFLTVNPLPGGAFEVIGKPGSAGPDFWCAAGDYAIRALGAAGTQRVYIVRGRGAPETADRFRSVQFALSPPSGVTPKDSLFLTMRNVGDNLPAVFAQTYCLDRKNLEF